MNPRPLDPQFWKQVEQLAPGIDTIDLPDDVAAAWKGAVRWRIDHNGARVPRRGVMDTLTTVRGFYADLIQLAHEDPGRWAQWACRPPVSEAEVKAYRKWRLSLRSQMHQRTRAPAFSGREPDRRRVTTCRCGWRCRPRMCRRYGRPRSGRCDPAPAGTLASGGTKEFVGPMDDALYVDLG
ncbi:MAG: hypothetical protein ACRDZS_11220 [Acidimicrobiales bacterium]